MRIRHLLIAAMLTSSSLLAQSYQPNWTSLDSRPVPSWFRDAKFGIFIHWGVYSVPGWSTKGSYAEWYQYGLQTGDSARKEYHRLKFGNRSYYDLANDFKAELFNPEEWASLFERSGAKYIVLTSKHHDGFTLWPNKTADQSWGFPWNAGAVGPKRDLLGDLFNAVRKTSVHAGMYYSLFEWFNPIWKSDKKKYVEGHVWPQMKELINTYKPDVFWTDGDWEVSDEVWKSKEFLSWLYNESPVKDKVVTYDRWGSNVRFQHGAVFTPEYQPDLDFEDHYWEESRGMGFSYGYNREEDAWDYNSAQSLVIQLIDKVSRGGNFLLDIGPDEHGKIPPIMQERLLQIGEWLKVNGEAIYNTERWKYSSQWSEGRRDYAASGSGDLLLKLTIDPDPGFAVKELFYTYNRSTNSLYAIFPTYPATRELRLKDFTLNALNKITSLSTGEKLNFSQAGKDVIVHLPPYDPKRMTAPYAYVIRIENYGDFTPKPKIKIGYPGNSLQPLVSIQSAPGTTVYYSLDDNQPSLYTIKYDKPFSVDRTATVRAIAVPNDKTGTLESAVSAALATKYEWKPALSKKKLNRGIAYKYFQPAERPTMAMLDQQPFSSGVTSRISIDEKKRKDRFGFRFEGYLMVNSDDLYELFIASDDGSKLYIDDELIIDNDGDHGTVEKAGKAALKKGFHKVRVDYFDSGGDNALHLSISGPHMEKTEVPASMLWY
jgi:alpha-L-fucosidase